MLTRRERAAVALEEANAAAADARDAWLEAVDRSLTGPVISPRLARLSGDAYVVYFAARSAQEAAGAEFDAAVEADRGSWAYRPGMQGPGGFGTVPREHDD